MLSHMVSESLWQLHAVATLLGIDRKHFQDKPGRPHYDICQTKIKMAMLFGAKRVDDREIIKLFNGKIQNRSNENTPGHLSDHTRLRDYSPQHIQID